VEFALGHRRHDVSELRFTDKVRHLPRVDQYAGLLLLYTGKSSRNEERRDTDYDVRFPVFV
jgi:hypothetical protein